MFWQFIAYAIVQLLKQFYCARKLRHKLPQFIAVCVSWTLVYHTERTEKIIDKRTKHKSTRMIILLPSHVPAQALLAILNVTAHSSTASVPITVLLYNGPLLCGFNVPSKGLTPLARCPVRIHPSIHPYICVKQVDTSQLTHT